MTDNFDQSKEMNKRKVLAEEFYSSVLDAEDVPYIVTDDACLYDFFAGTDEDLIQKIKNKYGVNIELQHFKIPFWKLLDWIQENRIY